MNSNKLINIIASLLGVVGAFWIGRGMMFLTPDIIGEMAMTKFGYNSIQIKNIAIQKADTISGLLIILAAFFIEFVNNIINIKDVTRKVSGFIIAGTISFLIIMLILNSCLKYSNINIASKYIVKQRFLQYLDDKKITNSEYRSIVDAADKLFSLNPVENESKPEFLSRYFQKLDIEMSEELDLSEIESK